MPHIRLTDRIALIVSGADAADFLQALVTANVETLGGGEARAGALLTPQGKILYDFLVSRCADGYRLDVSRTDADAFHKRLMMYRLRARVAFELHDGLDVFAGRGPQPEGALKDTRFPAGADIWRHYGDRPDGDEGAMDAWREMRIEAGVAELGPDYASADVFPHDVLFDLNGGVDFRKGCFVGQEVVSRMHHRGTPRRRPVILTGEGAAPLATATDVKAGSHTAGTTGTAVGNKALAILRIDRIADALAEGASVTVDERPVAPHLPDWTGLAFEQKSAE